MLSVEASNVLQLINWFVSLKCQIRNEMLTARVAGWNSLHNSFSTFLHPFTWNSKIHFCLYFLLYKIIHILCTWVFSKHCIIVLFLGFSGLLELLIRKLKSEQRKCGNPKYIIKSWFSRKVDWSTWIGFRPLKRRDKQKQKFWKHFFLLMQAWRSVLKLLGCEWVIGLSRNVSEKMCFIMQTNGTLNFDMKQFCLALCVSEVFFSFDSLKVCSMLFCSKLTNSSLQLEKLFYF